MKYIFYLDQRCLADPARFSRTRGAYIGRPGKYKRGDNIERIESLDIFIAQFCVEGIVF